MAAYDTIQDFANKVDWEGGISPAIEYGLKSTDLADKPEHAQFRTDWDALAESYRTALEMERVFYEAHLTGLDGW